MRVYGSRAREEAEPDSDMDVAASVSELTPSAKDLVADTAWEVGIGHLIHISAFVFSQTEIESLPMSSSPIVQNIMREGVVP